MIYAVDDVFFPDREHRLSHHGAVTILNNAGELAGPQDPESLFHFAEYELDRVVLRRVWNIEDESEAQLCCLYL